MVRVYVNRQVVAANRKRGESSPPITVLRKGRRSHGHLVELVGPARVVYRPDKPLSCGATLWIEAADAAVGSEPPMA